MRDFGKGFMFLPSLMAATAVATIQATAWTGKTALRLVWGLRPSSSPSSHGQAELSELPELRSGGYTRHTGGFYVGRMWKRETPWRSGLRRIYTDAESSVLMVGRKGAGKTQSVIADVKAIRLCSEALKPVIIVIDPVGEIEAATGPGLEMQGYTKRRIDLNHPQNGEQYDPLHGLRPGMPGYDFMLSLVAKSIIPEPVRETGNEHFAKGARGALKASIAHHQLVNPHGCTLQYCMERISNNKAALADLIADMKGSSSALVRNAIKTMDVVSPKEYGSFMSTLNGFCDPYLYENILETYKTRGNENGECLPPIDFLETFESGRKEAIFIRTGLYGKETGPFVRLVLSNAINTKRWLLNQWHEGGNFAKAPGLQRPTKIYTDETKNLGNCTALEEANDELRKARVNTFTVWLTRADIYNNMSGAKNLIGASVLILAGGNNDYETNMDMSRLIGDKTIYSKGGSYSRGGKSESYHEQGIPAMKPEAIRQVSKKKRLIIMDQIQFVPWNPWEVARRPWGNHLRY